MAFDVDAGQTSGRRKRADAQQRRSRQQVEIGSAGKLWIDAHIADAGRVWRKEIRAIVVVHKDRLGFQTVTAVAPNNVVAQCPRCAGRRRYMQAARRAGGGVGYCVLGKGAVDDIDTTAVVEYFAGAKICVCAVTDDQIVFKLNRATASGTDKETAIVRSRMVVAHDVLIKDDGTVIAAVRVHHHASTGLIRVAILKRQETQRYIARNAHAREYPRRIPAIEYCQRGVFGDR